MNKKSVALWLFLFAICTLLHGRYWSGPYARQFSNWTTYSASPDSREYVEKFRSTSLTPPVYHIFLGFFAPDHKTKASLKLGTRSLAGQSLGKRLKDPFYRAIWVQKMLNFLSLLFFSFCLGYFLPAIFCFLVPSGIYFFDLMSMYSNFILTESLAFSFFLIICGCYILFIKFKNPVFLISISLFCGLAYLTRPAAAYAATLLGIGILYYFSGKRQWVEVTKKKVAYSALSIFILGGAVFYDSTRVPEGNHVNMSPEFTSNYIRYIYALMLAQPEDTKLLANPQQREFLLEAIRLRKKNRSQIIDEPFLMKVHIPATNYIDINRYSQKALALYKAIHPPILEKYKFAYFRLRAETLWTAWVNHLFSYKARGKSTAFLALIGFVLLGIFVERGMLSWMMTGFVATYLANGAIMTLFMVPIKRYVNATEFILFTTSVISFYIILPPLWKSLMLYMKKPRTT